MLLHTGDPTEKHWLLSLLLFPLILHSFPQHSTLDFLNHSIYNLFPLPLFHQSSH